MDVAVGTAPPGGHVLAVAGVEFLAPGHVESYGRGDGERRGAGGADAVGTGVDEVGCIGCEMLDDMTRREDMVQGAGTLVGA